MLVKISLIMLTPPRRCRQLLGLGFGMGRARRVGRLEHRPLSENAKSWLGWRNVCEGRGNLNGQGTAWTFCLREKAGPLGRKKTKYDRCSSPPVRFPLECKLLDVWVCMVMLSVFPRAPRTWVYSFYFTHSFIWEYLLCVYNSQAVQTCMW